jgi:hypothetical protein
LNTISFDNLSLSFNITFKGGNVFRKNSINYYQLAFDGFSGHSDYSLRWIKPGDEKNTNVPSFPSVYDARRDEFYQYSGALIAKADQVRLQDIQVEYYIGKNAWKRLPVESIRIYLYGTVDRVLWVANDFKVDPSNASGIRPPKTLTVGLNINF